MPGQCGKFICTIFLQTAAIEKERQMRHVAVGDFQGKITAGFRHIAIDKHLKFIPTAQVDIPRHALTNTAQTLYPFAIVVLVQTPMVERCTS